MAERLLIALVAALALIGGGYLWGHTATDNAWTARQAKADKAAADTLQKETARADQAVGNYLREHLDQEERYAALDHVYQDLRTRAPLVVYRPAAAPLARRGSERPSEPVADSAVAQQPPDSPAVAPVLTFAAVRMWNGALVGADAPAGACGPAGASTEADAACAEASGLSLDDAWANHAINAKSCADDRLRYQHLINFLERK